MNQISIYYRKKTKLLEELEKKENINTIEDKSLLKKVTFSKKEYADIYFHSGDIDKDALNHIENSKKTIVNCFGVRNELIHNFNVNEEKIEVIYPSVDIKYEKPKVVKKEFCEKHQINPKKKIVLFSANNLKHNGIKEFFQILASIDHSKIKIVIASTAKQIYNLKFQISKFSFVDELLLLEDYEDMDELFLATDIYILPTYSNSFSTNVIKAMYCKCAVFVSSHNNAREVIDVFATMDGANDPSAPFKLDALISRSDDLKLIKKQNRKAAKEFELEKNIQRIEYIIQNV